MWTGTIQLKVHTSYDAKTLVLEIHILRLHKAGKAGA